MLRIGVGSVLMAVIGLSSLAVACSEGEGRAGGGSTIASMTRTIYMEAGELKGSTSVEMEPFPADALPQGEGYKLEEPDEEGKWVVETYTWSPDQIVVNQEDTVNLEIIGINGARHDAEIEGYVDSFVVERGKLTSLSFVADEAGVFKLICRTHRPTMTGELVVLPH